MYAFFPKRSSHSRWRNFLRHGWIDWLDMTFLPANDQRNTSFDNYFDFLGRTIVYFFTETKFFGKLLVKK